MRASHRKIAICVTTSLSNLLCQISNTPSSCNWLSEPMSRYETQSREADESEQPKVVGTICPPSSYGAPLPLRRRLTKSAATRKKERAARAARKSQTGRRGAVIRCKQRDRAHEAPNPPPETSAYSKGRAALYIPAQGLPPFANRPRDMLPLIPRTPCLTALGTAVPNLAQGVRSLDDASRAVPLRTFFWTCLRQVAAALSTSHPKYRCFPARLHRRCRTSIPKL
jgi:hypothetical protein